MLERTSILLVRHGQTEWNKQNRLQGHKNSALTEEGKHQALFVKQKLISRDIKCAYVSALLRAQETSSIIVSDRKIPEITLKGLNEISLGPWEGRTKEETRLSHPAEYRDFWQYPHDFHLKGAETYLQLQHRMVASINDIFKAEKNNTVLVVSHWIAIKVAIAYFSGISLNQLTTIENISNGRYVELVKKGNQVLIES